MEQFRMLTAEEMQGINGGSIFSFFKKLWNNIKLFFNVIFNPDGVARKLSAEVKDAIAEVSNH